MPKPIPTKQAKLPNLGDGIVDTDRITGALARAGQPDCLFQLAPAFEDAQLLGVDDPEPLVIETLENLARELGPDAVVVSVRAGNDVDPASLAGLSQIEIAQVLVAENRRQSIGIYLREAISGLEETARIAALKNVDLDVARRMINTVPTVPFAIRIPYRGVEAGIRALVADTGNRFSHEGEPCACGLFQLDDVNVGRVSIQLVGGGGSGAPSAPAGTGTPTDIVDSALTCSIAGVDLDARFSLHQRETLKRQDINGVDRLVVTSETQVVIEQLLGNNPVELQNELAEGSLGQRILAQLIRPAVAVTKGVRDKLSDVATGVLEDFAGNLSAGVFGTLAAALANDVLIPSGVDPDNPPPPPKPIPPAQKLSLNIDSVAVGNDRVDLVGTGFIVPRRPRAMIFGRRVRVGNRTRLEARVVLIEMRETPSGSIVWSSATGTFIGPSTGVSVVIEYEQGESLALAVVAKDADLQEASVGGVARTFIVSTFFLIRVRPSALPSAKRVPTG